MGSVLGSAIALAALAAGITAIGILARTMRRIIRTVAAWDRILELVYIEFKPNGGSTLRDAVDRLEASCANQEIRLVRVELDVKQLRSDP